MVDQIKAKLLQKLEDLQRKEEELQSMLEAVDVTLYDLGYHVEKDHTGASTGIMPQTGIRINGALSFRGKQKAEEYFKLLDTDGDGYVNFEDLRASKAFSSPEYMVHEFEYSNWESWKLFLTDNHIHVTHKGQLDVYNFVKYRSLIESKQPLSVELKHVGLGFLPHKLQEWAEYKVLWKEVLELREQKKTAAQKLLARNESLSFEELSFVMSNSGLCYTKPEIALMMFERVKKQNLMADLIRKYSKLNLSQPAYDFLLDDKGALVVNNPSNRTKVVVDDILQTEQRGFLPWVLSHLVTIDGNEMYRSLLNMKYKIFRGMRYFDVLTRHIFNFAAHMNDRLVFRDFLPVSKHNLALKEFSMLKFGVLIGEEAARDGGINGNFKLIKTDTPEQVLKKYRLPADAGTTVLIDFLYHFDITEDAQKKCVELIRQFILHHFEKELRNNPQFNGVYVLNDLSDGDNSKILRIAFSYKRIVSLDGFLEHMLLPYKFYDLCNVMVGEFRTNIDLNDWIKNRVVNLDETLAASMDFTVGIKRNLIIQILERITLAMSAGITKEQSELLDSEEHAPNTKTDEEEEGKRRLYRWRHLSPFFPFIHKYSTLCYHALKCMKTCVMKFKYSTIGECLFKWGVYDFNFHKKYPLHTVYKVAYVKECYDKFCMKYLSEFGSMFERLKSWLEIKKQKDDRKRRQELMGTLNTTEIYSVEKDKERLQTLEKMRRLGVIDTGGNDPSAIFEEEFSNPLHYAESLQDEQNKQDVQGLLTVEHVQKSLIGLQCVEVLSGKSRFTLNVNGLDFFELLPTLPTSMQVVKDKNVIRPKTPGSAVQKKDG